MKTRVMTAGAVLVAAVLVGCANQKVQNGGTLYTRLGGSEGVTKLVDAWVNNAVADESIKARFAKTDPASFKHRMFAFVSEASGGPANYMGKDMKSAHKGMNLSDEEWKAFMGDLDKAFDQVNTNPVDREELRVKLEPMKSEIVGQ